MQGRKGLLELWLCRLGFKLLKKDCQPKDKLLAAFVVVELVRDLIFDEFYHPGFVTEHPRDNLLRMLKTFRFDNRPSRMDAGIATPFKVMQIPSGMDLLHGFVTVLSGVG